MILFLTEYNTPPSGGEGYAFAALKLKLELSGAVKPNVSFALNFR
jgi:hypothetical protein